MNETSSATPKPRAGEHTKGPWRSGNGEDYNARQVFIRASEYDDHICVVDTEANARRIVACVNACESMPTEALEAGLFHYAIKLEASRDSLAAQNRELVEALAALIDGYGKWTTRQSNAGEWLEVQAKAKAILAKVQS